MPIVQVVVSFSLNICFGFAST